MRTWVLTGMAAVGLAGAAFAADHAELLPEDPIKPALVATCTACHDATEITTRRMSADRWDVMVSKMIDLGATVEDDDRPRIVAYLARNFGPPPPVTPAPAASAAPATPASAQAPATADEALNAP